MNKYIQRELKKCTMISIPAFDDNTTTLVIKAQNADIPLNFSSFNTNTDISVGKTYKIKLENYIINEPPNFTLSANWNHGTKPPETDLIAYIVVINGKMINISAEGATTHAKWDGWVPQKAIHIIENY